MDIDTEWAQQQLELFVDAWLAYPRGSIGGAQFYETDLKKLVHELAPVVRAILARLEPSLALPSMDSLYDASQRDAAVRAASNGLGMLRHADALERLRLDTPRMRADGLHDWVWQAAQSFWSADQYAVAVEQAAKSVTAHTQHKCSVSLSDNDLMQQVWSEDAPRPGRPRLRLPGDRSTKTWQSRQRAAGSLAQGCYGGIRNVVAHHHDLDWLVLQP